MFSDDFLLGKSLHLQKKSFQIFLTEGLIEELHNHFPIFHHSSLQALSFEHARTERISTQINSIVFHFEVDAKNYVFKKPLYSAHEAFESGETFQADLYVPGNWFCNNKPFGSSSFYCFGQIPMMTEEGHFLLHGSPRTLVGQLVRTPGIYYKVKFGKENKRRHIVSFLSENGCWFRIWTDQWGRIWARINKYRRIPIFILIRALGFTDSLFIRMMSDFSFLLKSYTHFLETYFFANEIHKAIIFLYFDLHRSTTKKPVFLHACEFLFQSFFQPKTYSFGGAGRLFLDTKLNRPTQKSLTLKPEDVLDGLEKLLQLEYGFEWTDNIDHLQNRRVRNVHELLQNEFSRGLEGIKIALNKKLSDVVSRTKPEALSAPPLWRRAQHNARVSTDFARAAPLSKIQNENFSRTGQTSSIHARTGQAKRFATASDNTTPLCKQDFDSLLQNIEPSLRLLTNTQSQSITKCFQQFFGLHPLSQLLDQSNPLSSVAHYRRLTSLGPGGVNRDAGLAVRDIHPSHFGRLCPIETPEGKNAGLVHSLALYTQINKAGVVQTPFRRCESVSLRFGGEHNHSAAGPYARAEPAGELGAGTLHHSTLGTKQTVLFTAEEEFYYSKGKLVFFEESLSSWVQHQALPVREGALRTLSVGSGGALQRSGGTKEFCSISPMQILSLATSFIPFLEHDDANRALMGSNMQRQAVSLLWKEKSIVGTGFEKLATQGLVATQSSMVYQTTHTALLLRTEEKVNLFSLKTFSRSNQATCLQDTIFVQPGELILKGTSFGDKESTVGGNLAIGKNLFIAYMPWEGYNFEDAVVISERLLQNDIYTSLHIEKYAIPFDQRNGEQLNFQTFHQKPVHELSRTDSQSEQQVCPTFCVRQTLDQNGIILPGSYVSSNSVLIAKRKPFLDAKRIPSFKLRAKIFHLQPPFYEDTSYRLSSGCEGRVLKVQLKFQSISFSFQKWAENYFGTHTRMIPDTWIEKEIFDFYAQTQSVENVQKEFASLISIQIYIATKRSLQIGDKVAGRHGNKGIVSLILPETSMPYVQDGTPVDMVLNPLGVPSRMNVGQIFESLLGLAGKHLREAYTITPFDEFHARTDRARIVSHQDEFCTNVQEKKTTTEISKALVYKKLCEARKKTGYEWLFQTNIPGKTYLFDGRTGEAFFHPITVGVSYILKLVHLVDDKIHARSTGPYALVTQQPLRGKARDGGQRIGEMEVWAVEGFGAAFLLQELLTFKADSLEGRSILFRSLVKGSDWFQTSSFSKTIEMKYFAENSDAYTHALLLSAKAERAGSVRSRCSQPKLRGAETLPVRGVKNNILMLGAETLQTGRARSGETESRTLQQNAGPQISWKFRREIVDQAYVGTLGSATEEFSFRSGNALPVRENFVQNKMETILPESFSLLFSELQALCLDVSSIQI